MNVQDIARSFYDKSQQFEGAAYSTLAAYLVYNVDSITALQEDPEARIVGFPILERLQGLIRVIEKLADGQKPNFVDMQNLQDHAIILSYCQKHNDALFDASLDPERHSFERFLQANTTAKYTSRIRSRNLAREHENTEEACVALEALELTKDRLERICDEFKLAVVQPAISIGAH